MAQEWPKIGPRLVQDSPRSTQDESKDDDDDDNDNDDDNDDDDEVIRLKAS